MRGVGKSSPDKAGGTGLADAEGREHWIMSFTGIGAMRPLPPEAYGSVWDGTQEPFRKSRRA